MSKLELNYLGDFEVLWEGQPAKLPPSKKTRALLAYLSLHERHFRREVLCELFWEIPDDPRGSLRWSLSKLRRAVDDGANKRIIADRSHVSFNSDSVTIDVLELLKLVNSRFEHSSTEELVRAAERYRGNFLEGMELTRSHNFHAWCVAQRENIMLAQSKLLLELMDRYQDQCELALPFARRLVAISPYDETVRSKLIRMLVSQRFVDEAEQQYRLGMRMLQEIGVPSSGALLAAWKRRSEERQVVTPEPVVERSVVRDRPIKLSSDFVGREAEMQQLGKAFAEVVATRRSQSILLSGEPGIGKSRILSAAAEHAKNEGVLLLTASAYESETLRPFALWIDALRKHSADQSAAIFADKTSGNREVLFDGLSEFLATEASEKPVVVLFDDVHWCDESTAVATQFVLRMNHDKPMLVILAGRSGELQDNVPLQQALRGMRHDGILAEIEIQALSALSALQIIKQHAPDIDADRISKECGGNPLLAIELARAESGSKGSGSLGELVRERLHRFDVIGTEVLKWAATLGPLIDVNLLTELSGQGAEYVGEVLESAESQAILQSTDSGLRFSHSLIARAIYNEISPIRRQVMHRRIAGVLEKDMALDLSRAADLAHHASQSGDAGLAARAMVSAGRLCLRFFSNDEAANLAKKGLQWVDSLTEAERVCVSIDLLDVMYAAAPMDDWEAVGREFAALAEQAVDHGELAHARLGYQMASHVQWSHGQWSLAREESLQSERVARSGSAEDQIIGMANTAMCLVMLERDLPQADAMLMEASARAQREHVSHHSIPAGVGLLRFHQNKMDEAEELLKEARTLCKAAGDRVSEYQANEYLMMINIEKGDFDAAAAQSEIMVDLGEKLRQGSEGPFARTLAALCDYKKNDNRQSLKEPLRELREADAKHRLSYALNRTAQIDIERGRLDSALECASEALELSTLLNRATEMIMANIILAKAHSLNGNAEAATVYNASAQSLAEAGVAEWVAARLTRENGK